jgi:hypothetical protein
MRATIKKKTINRKKWTPIANSAISISPSLTSPLFSSCLLKRRRPALGKAREGLREIAGDGIVAPVPVDFGHTAADSLKVL